MKITFLKGMGKDLWKEPFKMSLFFYVLFGITVYQYFTNYKPVLIIFLRFILTSILTYIFFIIAVFGNKIYYKFFPENKSILKKLK